MTTTAAMAIRAIDTDLRPFGEAGPGVRRYDELERVLLDRLDATSLARARAAAPSAVRARQSSPSTKTRPSPRT